MKMIFLGPPGAGKGTQAAVISKACNIPAISTGDMIRSEIKAETELGKMADGYIRRGELVPDDVVIGIVKERLSKDDCKNGYILDGFPRTIAQAEALIRMNISIDFVIDLDVSDDKIAKRMSGRLYCRGCGATYHRLYNPPQKENICDNCDTPLSVRDDDREDVVLGRLKVYHAQTKPLEDFYKNLGLLRRVDASKPIEEITANILTLIGKTEQ